MQHDIHQILEAIGDKNTVNVIEALNLTQDKFDDAFSIALEMENQNLVKLLYSNFQAGKIIVEITLVGRSSQKAG